MKLPLVFAEIRVNLTEDNRSKLSKKPQVFQYNAKSGNTSATTNGGWTSKNDITNRMLGGNAIGGDNDKLLKPE